MTRKTARKPFAGVAGASFLFLAYRAVMASKATALFTVAQYAEDAIALLALGLCLFSISFLGRDSRSSLSNLALPTSLFVLLLGVTDLYVLFFRFDTLGPGSGYCLTNARWTQRFVRLNEEGFWERSLASYSKDQQGGKRVIAMVGDSFTYGQGVLGADRRFSNLVEGKIAELGSDVAVLNFGLGNGATTSETEWIRTKVKKVSPEVVMIFYLSNDIEALDVAKASYPQFGQLLTGTMVFSPTFNFIFWNLVAPPYYQDAGNAYFLNLLMAYADPASMRKHLDDIKVMVKSVREIGADPVLVILPFPHMWSKINPTWQREIYEQIGAAAKSEGGDVIELQRLENEFTPAQFEVNRLDGHPNEKVHARIADELFAWLRSRKYVLTPGEAEAAVSLDLRSARLDASENTALLSRIVDGDLGTTWETEGPQQQGMWVEVELPTAQVIRSVELSLGGRPNRWGRSLQIALSQDGSTWTPVTTSSGRAPVPDQVVGAQGHTQLLLLVPPTRAKGVRVMVVGPSQYRWGLAEIEVRALTDRPGDLAPEGQDRDLGR